MASLPNIRLRQNLKAFEFGVRRSCDDLGVSTDTEHPRGDFTMIRSCFGRVPSWRSARSRPSDFYDYTVVDWTMLYLNVLHQFHLPCLGASAPCWRELQSEQRWYNFNRFKWLIDALSLFGLASALHRSLKAVL